MKIIAMHTRSRRSAVILGRPRALREMSVLLAFGAFMLGAQLEGRATTQMAYSFLVKTNGSWELWGNYLNGDAIVIENTEKPSKVVLKIRDLIPEKELHQSTAGAIWGECCLWHFVELDGRKMFRARTQYETDILIDLEGAHPVSARQYSRQLAELDKAQIISDFENASSVMPRLGSLAKERLDAAILHCASYSLTNCLPYLRKFESFDVVSSRVLPGSDSYTHQTPINRKNDSWSYSFYETRRLAALALRRLGESPEGFPAIVFLSRDKAKPIGAEIRRAGMARLEFGQTPLQVYKLLGAPAYIEHAIPEKKPEITDAWWGLWGLWRYDIDGQSPCTILVFWNEGGTLKKVERITPPLWQGDSLFSDDEVKPIFSADGSIQRAMQLYGGAFRGRIETVIPAQSASPNADRIAPKK